MKSTEDLKKAFEADGYSVNRIIEYEGRRGILAVSNAAHEKVVLYVEGSAFQTGYLIGRLACKKVERMVTEYIDNVAPAFIGTTVKRHRFKKIKDLLSDLIRDRCIKTYDKYPDDIPDYLKEEMRGIEAGCKHENPQSPVTYQELFLLNTGMDFVLSRIYAGTDLLDWIANIEDFFDEMRGKCRLVRCLKAALKTPLMCNAFSISGSAVEDGKHYFGRDFMFPTAGVFQDTACMIIYNPEQKNAVPIVSMTAPGFVGSITAMNSQKVVLGANMVAAQNCNPKRPGLNSLLLVRFCADYSATIDEAVDIMINAQRGVSWIYFIADGKGNRAAVVEAGEKTESLDYLSYPPEKIKDLLPKGSFSDTQQGLMIRWNDYSYSGHYSTFNANLFKFYGKKYNPCMEDTCGFFSTREKNPWKKKAVPDTFYFPPQREELPNVLIATNQFIIPQMRICSMGPWPSFIMESRENDFQWRYDRLNYQILKALGFNEDTEKTINFEKAREIIDFLSPCRKYPKYYKKIPNSSKGKRIEGSVSLCNLTDLIISSYFGYYDNNWIQISLSNYII